MLALIASSGCGGGEEAADRPAPPPPEPTEPEVVRTDSLRSLGVGTDTGEKPEFRPPSGSPPQNLQIYDVVEGKGAEAIAGRPLSLQYVGKSFLTAPSSTRVGTAASRSPSRSGPARSFPAGTSA